jgi:hypothetical protein
VVHWATFDQLGGVGPGPLARNSRKVANQLSPTSIFSRTIPPPTSNCNITNCLLTHAQPTNQHPPWWKSPSSYLRLLSVCCLALPSRVGLLCIGQQSKNSATSLVPNHAGRASQEPFTNTADHFRQSPVQLHHLAPMSFLLPLFRKFFFPTRSSPFRLLLVHDENFGQRSNSTNVAQ